MSTQEKIVGIVKQVSGNHGIPDPDESLFESGYLDSFALPDMISALENEFGIKIPDSDLTPRKFGTISQIESYLESRA
jgi:acyl carrier protein